MKSALNGICVLYIAIGLTGRLVACPFCSALSNTLREDMAASDYVALAVCTHPGDSNSELPTHEFRIMRIFHGDNLWSKRKVEVFSFRPFARGDVSLLFGAGDAHQTDWGPTQPLSASAQEYVRDLTEKMRMEPQVREIGSGIDGGFLALGPAATNLASDKDWLKFFWQHLSVADEWVRRDAYNEFARASLDDLRSAADVFDPEDLKKRIADSQTTIESRRLYWTLLSLSGRSQDASLAEQYLFREANVSPLPHDELGLDAAISCFLVLGGEAALEKVETRLLRDQQADYTTRYAAIVALRVQSTEFKKIAEDRLCRAFSHVLRDPNLADLVIPDLARLKDWSHIPQLVELFKSAEHEQKFLRIPVINYLRTCPLPDAKPALEECRQIDPDAHRRAVAFFPVPPTNDPQP